MLIPKTLQLLGELWRGTQSRLAALGERPEVLALRPQLDEFGAQLGEGRDAAALWESYRALAAEITRLGLDAKSAPEASDAPDAPAEPEAAPAAELPPVVAEG